jgi:NAD(P)-dependent dehydrogenase (short-subunit alcohol dehydrogenase family)
MQLALVVGFAETMGIAFAEHLGLTGWVVARAAHGPAACERAKSLRPKLIVVSRDLWSSEKRALLEAAGALAARVVETSGPADLDAALARLAS